MSNRKMRLILMGLGLLVLGMFIITIAVMPVLDILGFIGLVLGVVLIVYSLVRNQQENIPD